MAVYTVIEDGELADFLGLYDLGQLLSFQGIAEGVENSNFLLRTERANYILTLYEKRVNQADLPFFLGLMGHLGAAGLSCPLPVADQKGRVLGRCAGRPAAIVSFLNGTSAAYPGTAKCQALGRALAQLHEAASDFSLTRPNALGPESWPGLLASVDRDPADLPAGLRAAAAEKLGEILASWPDGLPEGIIHADLFPNNVLFVGDQLTGLIDFYFACRDILSLDLAICLNSWCFEPDGSFNITKSRALLAGYESVRKLSAEETAALPVLCAGAAMRFFLTRLYDWLNTPEGALVKPLNPMDYWAKLRFHAHASGPQAYGIGL